MTTWLLLTLGHHKRLAPAGRQILGHLPLVAGGAFAAPHVRRLWSRYYEAVIGVEAAGAHVNLWVGKGRLSYQLFPKTFHIVTPGNA